MLQEFQLFYLMSQNDAATILHLPSGDSIQNMDTSSIAFRLLVHIVYETHACIYYFK